MMQATNADQGLSSAAAAQALERDGHNELPSAKVQSAWMIAWRVMSEPMTLLLIACGLIYTLLGDWREALVLSIFVVVMIGISFYQEQKTEKALDALRELTSPLAQVLREGKLLQIPSREVVCGDILFVYEGDRVAADAILIDGLNLKADESLLTGESVAVSKEASTQTLNTIPNEMGAAGGDGSPYLFSGSLVIQGKGKAQVLQTGTATAIGKIGQALASIEETGTRVQRETRQVVKVVAITSLCLAVILAIWFALSRDDWMRGILVGITFAMALIPEELPVVLSLFLGIGAWRIAQKQVLTRRVAAIETLGATTVLCVDKTGTLTQNKMAVAAISDVKTVFHSSSADPLPESLHRVLEVAILACHRKAFDPMEIAILASGQDHLRDTEHLHQDWQLLEEYPLSKDLLAMSRVWRSTKGTRENDADLLIASKGAPEAIAELCHLSEEITHQMMAQVATLASQGLRVLAVAQANMAHQTQAISADALPSEQHAFAFELLGLIALADPIREGVPAAIAQCRSAGIRVVMITGDYPATALNIAQQCGIDISAESLSGSEMTALNDGDLAQKIKHINVFCRVMPEQKLRLVHAFRLQKEIVAMTGDGVNDAPALKAADIGIAMGKRGTDVARESASLVLLDDDFSSMVAAIQAGRRIFDNLRKSVSFIVAIHIPIIGLSFIPVMMGWPILLMPVHILVLELLIDPTCSLVFEAETEEDDLMQRPPRAVDQSIFALPLVLRAAAEGAALLVAVIGLYWFSTGHGIDTDEARAMAFACIISGNIGLILINRSNQGDILSGLTRPNPILWWVVGLTVLIVSAALVVPALSALFFFGTPGLAHISIAIGVGILTIAVISGVHRLRQLIQASV